jgi:hypothetical protein
LRWLFYFWEAPTEKTRFPAWFHIEEITKVFNGRFPRPALDVQFPSMNHIQLIQAKWIQAVGVPFAGNGGVSP